MQDNREVLQFDFKEYDFIKDYELIKNWKLFISPEGKILRVSPFEYGEASHDIYASEYMKKALRKDATKLLIFLKENHPKYDKYRFSYKDIMLDWFGFVSFENNEDTKDFIILKPDYEINKQKTTNHQIKVLLSLLSSYNANPDLIFQALYRDEERISQHYK